MTPMFTMMMTGVKILPKIPS